MTTIEECLKPPKGRKQGLRELRPSREMALKHLEKAENNLRAMRYLHAGKFYEWVVVTGYYAMYHAVIAALRSIGLLGLTHECSLSAFKLFFIKGGKIDKKFEMYFERAKELEEKYSESIEKAKRQRTFVQYRVVEVRNEDVEWIIPAAEEFVSEVARIIT